MLILRGKSAAGLPPFLASVVSEEKSDVAEHTPTSAELLLGPLEVNRRVRDQLASGDALRRVRSRGPTSGLEAGAAYLGEEDDGSLMVATFCPECAEREFRGEPVADTGG
jgi:hypothetical protein